MYIGDKAKKAQIEAKISKVQMDIFLEDFSIKSKERLLLDLRNLKADLADVESWIKCSPKGVTILP
ncbi:MAG: hypothetical protein ACXAC2_03725 [Candidatus Kariarchaeaceae archaeon]|jgi:hypothetical protein